MPVAAQLRTMGDEISNRLSQLTFHAPKPLEISQMVLLIVFLLFFFLVIDFWQFWQADRDAPGAIISLSKLFK